ALAEEGVGLVEEQDGAALLGAVEDVAEILLRLADVLADDAGQVDAIEVELQMVGEDVGGHRLARAGRARKERADAAPSGQARGEAPRLVHLGASGHLVRDLMELGQDVGWQDDVLPGGAGRETLGEFAEAPADLLAARVPEIAAREGGGDA